MEGEGPHEETTAQLLHPGQQHVQEGRVLPLQTLGVELECAPGNCGVTDTTDATGTVSRPLRPALLVEPLATPDVEW